MTDERTITLAYNAAPDANPGTWRWFNRGNNAVRMVSCPKCGRVMSCRHEFKVDGTVDPSLICGYEDCDFHEWVRWTGEAESAIVVPMAPRQRC